MGFGVSSQKSQQQAQSTSSSANQAYPFLQGALGNQVSSAGQGSNAIADLLGLNGSGSQTVGFDKFKDSSGFNFIKDEGIKGITNSAASKGMLNSGSALKAITSYGSNLASNFLNSYLSNLMGLSNNGLQAGQILSSAGNTSTGQSTSLGSSKGSSMNFSLQ
jgi:hypothetical protein